MIIISQLRRAKNSLKKTDRFTSKHKIYLYKEDFSAFAEILGDMTAYVLNHKGEEVTERDIRFQKRI
jgi:tRNA pseudouridine-54 N-methylase